MKKLILACTVALSGLMAHATATVAQLTSAIGSPSGVTVLSSSTWDVGSDSGVSGWATVAKSSNKGQGNSTSQLDLQVTGGGSLGFTYRISSESGYDKLMVYVDGVEDSGLTASGHNSEVYTASTAVAVAGSGTHTISLRYVKDTSGDKGEDTVWVCKVTWGTEVVITIPAEATKVAASAYAGNTTVTKIVFEEGCQVKEIGNNAFKGCTALKSLELPEGVTTLGDGVFDGCSSLTNVVFPASLESLGTVNLNGMTALNPGLNHGYRIVCDWVVGWKDACPATIPNEDRIRGFAKEALKNNPYLESFSPQSRNLVSIGPSALYCCFALRNFELPSSLKNIGEKAFYGCTQLEEIAIPGGVATIGASAFSHCYGLQYAAIASGVTAIGENAFNDDYLLMEIDIPATVTTFGTLPFGGDSSMIRVGLRGDVKPLSEIFSNYQHLREVVVKAGDKELNSKLFYDCAELEDVRFLATEAPGLESSSTSPFNDAVPQTLTVYVPYGSTGWGGITGAYGLPQAWPKNSAAQRRAIAYWNVPTYLVEFDSNGGSLGVQPTYQTPETTFDFPPQPTQSGYTFAGWWTSPVEGWQVTEETIFLEGVYTKLYAHWTRPHKIFLNANGGTVTNATITYVEQTVYGVLPAPVRTGYAFGGWTYGDDTIVPNKTFVTDSDHTLTAQWQAYRYSVHFNPNGGTGSVIAQEFKYDTLQSLDACRYTRKGYTFVGWATSATGAVVYQDAQKVKNLTALQGGIVNLYAKWAPNYTIVFNKCDGSGVKASQAFPYGYSRRLPACKNGLRWQRAGYTFKGWATSEANAKAGTIWKADWAMVATAAAAGTTLNVYAVWQVNSGYYQVRYNKYDGSGAFRTEAFEYNMKSRLSSIRYGLGWSRKGFVFKGWATSAAGAAAGTVWAGDWALVLKAAASGATLDLYAIWEVDASDYYAIKFMKNDGGAGWRTVGFQHGVDTHLPTCKNGLGWTRTGYTFKGWATSAANATAGKVWKADYAIVASPVAKGATLTVYAVWQANAASQVVQPPAAAQVKAASAAAPTAELLTGELVDGSATYRLLRYADGTAYLQLEAANGDSRCLVCEVTDLRGVLAAVAEDGEIYYLLAD